MDEQYIERKKKALTELKQFARAEMARDLAKRHGRTLKLAWDPEESAAPQPQQSQGLDDEALQALQGLASGD